MLKQPPKTTRIARNLRKRESWGERLMWSWLRDHRFADYKFRGQHPIDPYVLDFFYNEAKLDVEVDGFQHGIPDHSKADAERDALLESQGVKVLRFWSSRLKRDKETIHSTIWRALQERAPHPLPNYCRPGVVAMRKEGGA
jgi:very-short-patch-repair endonuclease